MAKRVILKIGDIFSVKIDENNIKYFQYIADDLLQLNSYVIRAFKRVYPIDTNPQPSEIVNDEVDFYVHCFLRIGVKMGFWEKVGNSIEIGETKHILFRGTEDYGCKVGEEPVKISNRWYVWHINDKDFTYVGKLKGKNREAEIGGVLPAFAIVDRMKTGIYDFFYPGFE